MTNEFKVVTVGDSGVGKTSLVNQFYSNTFNVDTKPTVGAAYLKCSVNIDDDSKVLLNIWDTAGQEKFHSLISLYIRNANACIIVCDITNELAFQNVEKLYKSLIETLEKKALIYICANKIDLEDQIDTTKIEEFAEKNKLSFFKTSAMTGSGVNELFFCIAAELLKNSGNFGKDDGIVNTELIENNNNKKCC
ncbi:Ras-related protein Rab-5A [Tritrichomonas foetus]|uniref:Ras-related protein Rab-5A n=1 Tax=Tritrichomonas foetus TaxID=1144522 RepID=A0A1J4KF25_9EUKA|nr:Ras-related protein Rab-5A [Tritrichomonas foetus]|eukprot:OHT09626.1 Ras-related protein Rab-5A [Tritrichomonas foetus]